MNHIVNEEERKKQWITEANKEIWQLEDNAVFGLSPAAKQEISLLKEGIELLGGEYLSQEEYEREQTITSILNVMHNLPNPALYHTEVTISKKLFDEIKSLLFLYEKSLEREKKRATIRCCFPGTGEN